MFMPHVRGELLFLPEPVSTLLTVEPVLVVVNHLVALERVDADEGFAALGAHVGTLLHVHPLWERGDEEAIAFFFFCRGT